MSRIGIIQNEEFIAKALYEDREFSIPCKDSKDANSKRVSLYNARRRLSPADQRKIIIRKEALGDQWVITVTRSKQEVMEIIDGKLVPYVEITQLSTSHREQLKEMVKAGYTEDEVIEALTIKGYNEKSILAGIEQQKYSTRTENSEPENLQRQMELMKKDGLSTEEIREALK